MDPCLKVMSLLFNMLSRLVIAFLPRSKPLLISWLQSPSAVILEPKKIKSVTVSIVSPSICHEVMELDAVILVFWTLSFKPTFPLSSFTFIKRPFAFRLKGGIIRVSEVIDNFSTDQVHIHFHSRHTMTSRGWYGFTVGLELLKRENILTWSNSAVGEIFKIICIIYRWACDICLTIMTKYGGWIFFINMKGTIACHLAQKLPSPWTGLSRVTGPLSCDADPKTCFISVATVQTPLPSPLPPCPLGWSLFPGLLSPCFADIHALGLGLPW